MEKDVSNEACNVNFFIFELRSLMFEQFKLKINGSETKPLKKYLKKNHKKI